MNLKLFRISLREKLKEQKLTLSSLSALSDLSEDTLRSIIYGKSQDIKLSTLIKIADVLNCSIDELINRSILSHDEKKLFERIHKLPAYSLRVIQVLVSLEEKSLLQKTEHGKDIIPVFIPNGNMKDDMYYDRFIYDTLNITNYPQVLKKESSFGLKIQTDYFEPLYFQNDILLLSTNHSPGYNDIVLYINTSGKIYIRKYTKLGLEPLGRFGELIPHEDIHNYTALGIVLRTIHEFDIEQYR